VALNWLPIVDDLHAQLAVFFFLVEIFIFCCAFDLKIKAEGEIWQ